MSGRPIHYENKMTLLGHSVVGHLWSVECQATVELLVQLGLYHLVVYFGQKQVVPRHYTRYYCTYDLLTDQGPRRFFCIP